MPSLRRIAAFGAVCASSLALFACSAKNDKGGDDPGLDEDTGAAGDGSTGDGSGFDLGAPFDDVTGLEVKGPCKGLQCQQVNCGAGVTTTISGTVYAPNGTMPLYNVIVYVPNAELSPFPKGSTCDKCGA